MEGDRFDTISEYNSSQGRYLLRRNSTQMHLRTASCQRFRTVDPFSSSPAGKASAHPAIKARCVAGALLEARRWDELMPRAGSDVKGRVESMEDCRLPGCEIFAGLRMGLPRG